MKYQLDVIPTSFNDHTWNKVVSDFNQCSGLNFDKAELKKHLSVLRKHYRIVKPLYKHGGFGWDNRRKMVDVDDRVWAEYIEVHPEIIPYRKYGCPICEELCHIFTKPKATGEFAVSSTGYKIHNNNPGLTETSHSSGQNKRKSSTDQPPKSGDNKRNSVGPDNSKQVNTSDDDEPYSTANSVVALNNTPGVNQSLYKAAVDLFENPTWRKTFVTMKMEKRLGWLKAMIPRKT
ncbi:L10-interacting MYB domain-containing protein-like [Nicotiana sylvestris]